MAHTLKWRDLGDEGKLVDYLEDVDFPLLGDGNVMGDEFVAEHLNNPKARNERQDWLEGRDKDLKSLLRLCHRPVVETRGDETIITYNRMSFDGSVLRRTIHAKPGKWLEITGIDSVEIRRKNTFSYPLVR